MHIMDETIADAANYKAYPVYVLPPSPTNGAPELPVSPQDHAGQFEETLWLPIFQKVKGLILDKSSQPDNQYHLQASPLITYTAYPQDKVETIFKRLCAADPLADLYWESNPGGEMTIEKTTLPDGALVNRVLSPARHGKTPSQSAKTSVHTCLATLSYTLSGVYNEHLRQNPGKVIRIPLSQIRVRDVVVQRLAQEMLDKVGLSSIKVLTDNVQRAGCKEATTEPIDTFCAHCLLLSLRHKRCSGCMVSFTYRVISIHCPC